MQEADLQDFFVGWVERKEEVREEGKEGEEGEEREVVEGCFQSPPTLLPLLLP